MLFHEKNHFGGGWYAQIISGDLAFTYQNVEKATIATDGSISLDGPLSISSLTNLSSLSASAGLSLSTVGAPIKIGTITSSHNLEGQPNSLLIQLYLEVNGTAWLDGAAFVAGLFTASGGSNLGGQVTLTSTTTGLRLNSLSSDPSSPVNGELWYRNDLHLLKARVNGSTVTLAVL